MNVDLPWNPAKLEQRIARAWRKNQTRTVTVVNLVCEDSIEHSMLHLLGRQAGAGRRRTRRQGRPRRRSRCRPAVAAMIERMNAMMQAAANASHASPQVMQEGGRQEVAPEEAIAEELKQRHGKNALLIEARRGEDGSVAALAVLDLDRGALAAETKRLATNGTGGPAVEVIDRATWHVLQRLQAAGMLQLVGGPSQVLHRLPELGDSEAEDAANAAKARASGLHEQADRVLRKAHVLAAGGFPEEVPALLVKAIGHAGAALLAGLDELPADVTAATSQQIRDLVDRGAFPLQAMVTLEAVSAATDTPTGPEVERLLDATAAALADCLKRMLAPDQ